MEERKKKKKRMETPNFQRNSGFLFYKREKSSNFLIAHFSQFDRYEYTSSIVTQNVSDECTKFSSMVFRTNDPTGEVDFEFYFRIGSLK